MNHLLQHTLAEVIGRLVPRGLLRWSFVALAMVAIGGAIASLVFGIPILALVLLVGAGLFGGAAYVISPAAKAIEARYIDHAGATRPAFVVRLSRGRSLVAGAISALVAIFLAFLVVVTFGTEMDFSSPWNAIPSELRWPLVAGVVGIAALFAGAMAVIGLANGLRGAHLAVLRDGIVLRSGLGSTFVPWSLVTHVGIDTVEAYGSHAFLVVRYDRGPGLRLGAMARLTEIVTALAWWRAPGRGQLRIQSSMLLARDRDVAVLLAFYLANPDSRGHIGSAEGLRRAMA